MQKTIAEVKIECIKGDIVSQPDIIAIVNAANAYLKMGSGVAGAIHSAAGPGLEKECRPLAPIKTGQAVITSGQNLKNRYVIHCLGPVYDVDKPEDELLRKCYSNALELAEKNEIDSIAFPAISTGVFKYPVTRAAEIALKTITSMAAKLKYVKKIRFVLYDDANLAAHDKILSQICE